jgi:hypothetical protein
MAPANDNIDPEEPYRRAKRILDAYFSGRDSKLGEDHKNALTSLVTDLMHYCDAENFGKTDDDPHYLNFEEIFKTAEKDFQVQAKGMNSVREKATDTQIARFWDAALNSGNAPLPVPQPNLKAIETDPKLVKLLKDLADRQAVEAERLHERQAKEGLNPLRHEQERDAQLRKFEDEKQRYIRQFNRGRELAEQMRGVEKQEGLDHDFSE